MKQTIFIAFTLISCCIATCILAQDMHYEGAKNLKPTVEMKLWPSLAPGETETPAVKENLEVGAEPKPIHRISNVTEPMLSVFPAASNKSNNSCVIVFPGGGYHILAYNHEGTEIAHWLNSLGVTAVVVKYRVPRRSGQPKHFAALQDAQRAIRLVRKNASEWKIDPARIGVLGFSAGAHLTLMASCQYDQKTYEPVDSTDSISAKPDFAAPIYLAYALGEKIDTKRTDLPLESELTINEQTPRMFLSVADDDPVGSMGSVQLYMKLKENGVSAELHVFAQGGHGYGIRSDRGPAATWNQLCAQWMKQLGLIE